MCKKSTLNIIFISFIFQLITSCTWFEGNKQPKQRTPTSDSDASEISTLIASFEAASTNEQKIKILESFKNLEEGAKDAVPILIKELKSKDSDYLDQVVNTLAIIGPAASEAIPALIECFDKDVDCNDDWVSLSTINALGIIGINSEVVAEFLVKKLKNPEITKYSDLPFRISLFTKKLDQQTLDAIDENVLILENLTIPILFKELTEPQTPLNWSNSENIYQFFARINREKFINICLKYINECSESRAVVDLLEQNKILANDFIQQLINIISSSDVKKPIKAAAINALQFTEKINSEAVIAIRDELRKIDLKNPNINSDDQEIIDSSIKTLTHFSDQAKSAVPEIIKILLAGYYLPPNLSGMLTEYLSDGEKRDLVKKLEFFLLNDPTNNAIPIILRIGNGENVIPPYIDYLDKKISKNTTAEELLSIYHIEFLYKLENIGFCPSLNSSKKIIPIIIESLKKINDKFLDEFLKDLKDFYYPTNKLWGMERAVTLGDPPLSKNEKLALALSDSLKGFLICKPEKQDQDIAFLSKVEANEAVKTLIQIYEKIKVNTPPKPLPFEEYPYYRNPQTQAKIKLNLLKTLVIFRNMSDILVPEITNLLSNSTSKDLFRIEVIKVIGEIGKSDKALVEELLRRIKVDIIPGDQEENPAYHAAFALVKLSLDSRDVVLTIINSIKDKSTQNVAVRMAGVAALGNAKAFASDAIPALKEALNDPDKNVQENAQDSLNKIK